MTRGTVESPPAPSFLLWGYLLMTMSKQNDYIVKVAKHITSQTKIVPLGVVYGLIYPFMDSEDIYYVSTLEHSNSVILNDLKWYAKEYYGMANDEIYDLIDVYQAMVSQKLKNLIN